MQRVGGQGEKTAEGRNSAPSQASLTGARCWRGVSAGLILAVLEEGAQAGSGAPTSASQWPPVVAYREGGGGGCGGSVVSGQNLWRRSRISLSPSRAAFSPSQVGKQRENSTQPSLAGQGLPPSPFRLLEREVGGKGKSPPSQSEVEAVAAAVACCYYRGYQHFLTSGSYAACV